MNSLRNSSEFIGESKWIHWGIKVNSSKKNILKSNNFGVMQTVFFAFTCKFGLCLHVEKVIICINKTNWHPLVWTNQHSNSIRCNPGATNLLKQRFILFIVYFAKLLCWAVTWPCYCRYFPFHLGLNKIIFQMQGIKVHINKYLHNAQKGIELSKLIRLMYFLASLLLTIMHPVICALI